MSEALLRIDDRHAECAPSAAWPARCVRCNEAVDRADFPVTVVWCPAWVLLVSLLSGPLMLAFYFLVRRTARLRVGLCARHRTRRSRATRVFAAIGAASVASCVGGLLEARAAALLVPGAAGILATLVYAGVWAPVVKASFISGDVVRVGLDGAFLRSLPSRRTAPATRA
jgi:hypothetical protein